jgi:hypothetical protein
MLAGLGGIATAQTDSTHARVVTAQPRVNEHAVFVVSGTPAPARPVTFTASPNPITLAPGAVLGKTTLTWNAPAHNRLVIRVDETKFGDALASSGSLDTGPWVTDGMVFALIDPVIGQTLASITVKVNPAPPPPPPATLTANPNPITLPPGATEGQTTLSWNAPGYSQLVIRVNGNDVTGTLGTSGSTDTGDYVTDGMIFSLVDLGSGKTIATVTVRVIITKPPSTLTIASSATTAALAKDSLGNADFCATPASQSVYRSVDSGVWIWLLTANGQPGDVFAINWVHPSGRVEPNPPTVTLDYSGGGCYAWFLKVQGAQPASEPGNWQVRILVNGATAVTQPFTILSSLTITNKTTTAGLVSSGAGPDFCATPITKTAFQTSDSSVYVWFTLDNGRPGDVLAINWIHPSGQLDSFQPGATLNYSGSGCYAWNIDIRGGQPATEPGPWQVRLLVNGSTAFSLPFTIGR